MMLRARERPEVRTWPNKVTPRASLGPARGVIACSCGQSIVFLLHLKKAASILKKLESVVTKSRLEGYYQI